MPPIQRSKKYQNGIRFFWTDTGTENGDFFSYEELIGMKINALDILNNPELYRIDAASHRIESPV
jgi:hypothetical protein